MTMELTDDEVFGSTPSSEMSDEEVFGKPPSPQPDVVDPDAFLAPPAFWDRVQRGAALKRVLDRAGEGFGSEPLGLSDEHVRQLRDLGIFYNPATGRPGYASVLGEAAIDLTANTLDAIMRSVSAGIHGAGAAFGEIVKGATESELQGQKAEREAINFGNFMMIESGMGHYGRPHVGRDQIPQMQPIGGLPRDVDFRNAAEAIVAQRPRNPEPERVTGAVIQLDDGSIYVGTSHVDALAKAEKETGDVNVADRVVSEEHTGFKGDFITSRGRLVGRKEAADVAKAAEQASRSTPYGLFAEQLNEKIDIETAERNLRQLWQERGIHPAEAAHDAGQDAFLRDEIANPEGAHAPNPFAGRQELIGEPAYRTADGRIFTGVSHGGAQQALEKAYGSEAQRVLNSADVGFVTNAGRFVSNQDAFQIARSSGQLSPDIVKRIEDVHREWGIPPELGSSDPYRAPFDLAYRMAVQQTGGSIVDLADIRKNMGSPPVEDFHNEVMSRIQTMQGTHGPNIHPVTTVGTAPERLASAIRVPGFEEPFITYSEKASSPNLKEGVPTAGGADVTRPENLPTLEEQPPPAPGSLIAAVRATQEKLFDVGHDIQMMTVPMAAGTSRAQAVAKDFANAMRRNRWEWARYDQEILNSPELKAARDRLGETAVQQRQRMWEAADEESVARQLGESTEHQGLVRLEPEERAFVDDMQARAQLAWAHARDLGMVEGEGLPAYTPRMVLNVAEAGGDQRALPLNSIGRNLRTTTSQLLHREHMMAEETEAAARERVRAAMMAAGKTPEEIEAAVAKVGIARDIRSLPLATAKLEDAIAGRTLINAIQDIGRATGDDTVSIGSNPGKGWFTIDHPAFYRWQPKYRDGAVVKDADGNTVFDRAPIYVSEEFRGPLNAVLTHPSGATYQALMSLKGKTMGLIMNSPIIHNAVEWGRALPAMPGKVATFRIYFQGNAARRGLPYNGVAQHVRDWWTGRDIEPRNAPPDMVEAINAGMVPIGHRFFNQDISSIMEEPNLSPGRGLTAQTLGLVPGLFDQAAGDAVKAAVDKAGDFWHNTLLWDRVADLQMGLYVNFRDGLLQKGVDRLTASRAAAHWANRYAGALPVEAMSDGARKISNLLLFSRSFTLGNIGAMKDMLTGLPKDVMAQIERDGGMLDPKAVRSLAVRKAIAIVTLDMGLMYIGNSLLQNGMNVLTQDSTLDAEMHGYAQRMADELRAVKEHPLKLLQPLSILGGLSATSENEPGRDERIRVGYASDGTAIYARNPAGKIGEEFTGYLTGPLDMIRRKLGTIARPVWQIMANDKGFGRKVYDPNADAPEKYLANMGAIAKLLAESQLPEGQIGAFMDLVKGEGDAKVNALQAFGPIAGVTFAKGAPGGPAIGELYHARETHDYAVQAELPDIRKQIQRGDVQGARDRMTELGIAPGLQRYYIRTSQDPRLRLSPKALRDFYLYGTPEQRERMERLR